ncbi:MAG: putative membrane-bound dehydrogenase-like protein [Kiritimatiellia bacterium]|jgi:putative membrane-bound dehydrogenase-like protein
MKPIRLPLLLFAFCVTASFAAPTHLFDGKTLDGWEGETREVWRVRDGVIVGGSLEGNPRNEFLSTKKPYKNFHLRLEYKIVGTEGFVNGGVQFRSKRIANPPNEMSGYQADIGAGYSGSLYDESRRNKFLAQADAAFIKRLEKPGEWNSYEIVARGAQSLLFLNGQRTAIWVERAAGIEDSGLIALQIHGNCKAEISFRNITIDVLPDSAVPSEGEILSRFGKGQPVSPIAGFKDSTFAAEENEVIVFVGQENLVREQKAGELEAILASALAEKQPRFRSMAWEADTVYEQWRELNFGDWSRQLDTAGATTIVAQFGQMEALDGVERLTEFTASYHRLLDQFAARTRKLVLISPLPFEKPKASHAPDLTQRNQDVAAYVKAVRDIARQRGAVFVDVFTPLVASEQRRTEDGIHLTESGLREVAHLVATALGAAPKSVADLEPLRTEIVKKNQLWFDCWRPSNWSFVYGDRVNQMFGRAGGTQPSLQKAFEAQLPLVEAADARIHALANGKAPPPYPDKPAMAVEEPKALTPDEQIATFTLAEGYQVNLFASEADGVVNPTQFSWDEKGRLYVACSPTYPQTLAAFEPADYIVVLQDTDGDGRADTSTRFAEGLTMVQGVEPGAGGVYVCDFDRLLHLVDRDGDGKADERHVIFSGFGIGDTHQLVNSICHGPDGSLWFTQGLHAMSRVETPWGIARLDRAAVWRLNPRTLRMDGFFGGGMAGANCWGVAFDDYGQVFHKSGDRPQGYWSVPGMVRGANPSGSGSQTEASASYRNSPVQYHSVGPLFNTSPKTTALDIVGTKALPEDIQGCALIGGYFGAVAELHRFEDAGSGFKTTQLPKLIKSSNSAFRPVDVSVGPDGAMYLADWYNPIIGHYQASYADPRRDKTHGRIWRISAKNLPSVKQPDLAAMSPAQLLEQLRSPERWTRYQAKRLLFDAPTEQIIAAADKLTNEEDEHFLLELAGVFEAHETVRPGLLAKLLAAKDPRVRAYGTRVAGMWADRLPDALSLLGERARDTHPRVRLEAVVAASYVPRPEAVTVVTAAVEQPRDPFLDYAMRLSARALQSHWGPALTANKLPLGSEAQTAYLKQLLGTPPKQVSAGETLYEMACLACHQPEGKGLPGVYPPLAGSEWIRGDKDTLIKIVLHGLTGPVTVAGQTFGGPNAVPMPAMGGLNDQQIAEVISFVRSSYGQGASAVTAAEVQAIRSVTSDRTQPWTTTTLGK